MLEDIRYEFYESVDSTNDRIKERARAGEKEGLVISAGMQTAGKGRIGRKWQSPVGESIATSILLRPAGIDIAQVPTVTIIAAMAVRSAIEKSCGISGLIKWPNDIVVDGKKICGILTEMEMSEGRISHLVCGIGVNVHNRTFSEDIAYKATSIDLELEKANSTAKASCKEITECIWESFKKYYNVFLETGDMTNLREEYEKYLANKNARVRIEDPEGAYEARALGIDNRGQLLVEVGNETRCISTGEVSVRGIYGYI
ncbi:MAG: biotin--[acetyl-CoA-carboxylase] ligase [Pseudobutyrivibrio sp.]|nr:biotin--[acetyl-CoA-carboxylase] ligase [Pseudobutyrivibrio sp.]